MARQEIADGRWFDPDAARVWEEGTKFDGNNRISLATGSQWDHEQLYLTAKGHWVVNAWSQWQGTSETYRAIDPAEAAMWLVRNEHDLPECLAVAAATLEA